MREARASFICRVDLPTLLLNYRASSYIRFAARNLVETFPPPSLPLFSSFSPPFLLHYRFPISSLPCLTLFALYCPRNSCFARYNAFQPRTIQKINRGARRRIFYIILQRWLSGCSSFFSGFLTTNHWFYQGEIITLFHFPRF